jgi:hypothetical protein
MIQDAHPMRSGVPDCYVAKYKIDVVVAATTWTLNSERLPSGFNAGGNVFISTGRADLVFPAGMKVRGARAMVDNKAVTAAGQLDATLVNINEAAGTCSLIVTDRATPTLANPTAGSVIYAELDLESV